MVGVGGGTQCAHLSQVRALRKGLYPENDNKKRLCACKRRIQKRKKKKIGMEVLGLGNM